ncbi:helix-turn-helix transcriptional regulator [Pseudofrankia inefficax]|uniref:helix-turn-helix transcriptional regulator n=1 Tax=Pseudofrankia inefficax (strain DSM 45817 / CECT 9037 / DDB 130130 / EuI1c) TaxID=298654 RepID=UPI0002EB0F25|nr:LuxR C-terminal-related transcriptional regulator [Pseudofrankia inefficax]
MVGRDHELAELADFVGRVRTESEVRLVTGDRGIGKSALLTAGARLAAAAGLTVLRTRGAAAEADLGYAGLNRLLLPVAGELVVVPPGPRRTLETAIGLREGPSPTPLVVGTALLELMWRLSASRPVLLVVDDAARLDGPTAAALTFTAARLAAVPVGIVFAFAARPDGLDLAAEEWTLTGLDEHAAAELVDREFPDLAPVWRRRAVVLAEGNPRGLLEIAAAALAERVADRQGSGPTVTDAFRRLVEARLAGLAPADRDFALITALEGVGDLRMVEAALTVLRGEQTVRAEPSRRVGLVVAQDRVSFVDPVIQAAVVAASGGERRRQAHAALASVLSAHPARHAWHLAEAAVGPDELVARRLDDVGALAAQDGDATTAERVYSRAADLSTDPAGRATRLARTAGLRAFTGDCTGAATLLSRARWAHPAITQTPLYACVAVQIVIEGGGDLDAAYRLLAGALATAVDEPADDALFAGLRQLARLCALTGRADHWAEHDRLLRLVRPQPPAFLRATATLAQAGISAATGELPPAEPLPRQVAALLAGCAERPDQELVRHAGFVLASIDQLAGLRHWVVRAVVNGRELPITRGRLASLGHLCLDQLWSGHWDQAGLLVAEGLALIEAAGLAAEAWPFHYVDGMLAAARGDVDAASTAAGELAGWSASRAAGAVNLLASRLRALAALAAGDAEDALRHALVVGAAPVAGAVLAGERMAATLDLADAAARLGRPELARLRVAALADDEAVGGSTRLALVAAVSQALVAPVDAAGPLFEAALRLVDDPSPRWPGGPQAELWPFERARARLACGEWLRRRRSTVRAAGQLKLAEEAFTALGAHAWARRANKELAATGQGRRPGQGGLTPQELQIAELAASGLTNRQIAERLFVSPRTVGAHLHRVFPKLGITSRAALRDALVQRAPAC